MRVNSFIYALTLATIGLAKTEFVTRYHYITVDSNGNTVGVNVSLEKDSDTPSVAVPVATSDTNQGTFLTTLETSSPTLVNFQLDAQNTIQPSTQTSPAVDVASQSQTIAQTVQPHSTSTVSGADGTDGDEFSGADVTFAKAILNAHNTKRSAHSALALTWSATLYNYAQNYADSYSCGSSLVHSGGKFGENLAYGYSSGVAALEGWYSEGSNYDFSSANVFDHFTQVIWKSTTKLGCAYKSCGGGLYVICSYDPAGNYLGEGPQNLS